MKKKELLINLLKLRRDIKLPDDPRADLKMQFEFFYGGFGLLVFIDTGLHTLLQIG